jgi:hypothetical protein
MTTHVHPQDVDLLSAVAEHRVLTISQLGVLCGRNVPALHRRLKSLECLGLVHLDARGLREARGRPERLVSLSDRGVGELKEHGSLPPDTPVDQVIVKRGTSPDHQLMTNEFRAQLSQLTKIVPACTGRFLSPTSPLIERDRDGHPIIHERFQPEPNSQDGVEFTPDGVLCLTHSELGRTLLFFLEVDMATEPLTSRERGRPAVGQKILNYQAYLSARLYKRYEGIWKCNLGVPRLLFLANDPSRMDAICRLVFDMPPSGFVWVTDQASLMLNGVWGLIWAPGGQLRVPRQSILGSVMPIPHANP